MSRCISDSVFVKDWLNVDMRAILRSALSFTTFKDLTTVVALSYTGKLIHASGSVPARIEISSPSKCKAALDDGVTKS
jgi:hypothetical protein